MIMIYKTNLCKRFRYKLTLGLVIQCATSKGCTLKVPWCHI